MSIKYNDKTNNREILLAGISSVDQILGNSKNAIANKAVFNALKEKIDKTVSDLVNYYSKSDVYNKTEVRALISTISTMDIQVVNALPTEDISTTTIYFLKPTGATTYDEYVYINNAWVKIGTTDLDLSQYVTNDSLTLTLGDYYSKAEIDTLLAQYAQKDNVYDKNAVDALLDDKQDVLTFDNVPTENSNNVVKSGGVYSAVDNVYKMIGENSAKNLLPNSKTTATVDGITYTAQSDGSFIVTGATTASPSYSDVMLNFTLPAGTYIFSSPNTGIASDIELVLDDITSGTAVRVATLYNSTATTFTLDSAKTLHCYMWINKNITLPSGGIHFYPMIRLASDPDETYQPYAMTNRELTGELTDSGQVIATDVIWTTNYNNIVAKSGNSVNLCCGGVAATTSIVPQSTVLARLPEGYRPKINVPISMIWATTPSDPTYMNGFALVKTDGSIVSMHGSSTINMQYWMLNGSFGI